MQQYRAKKKSRMMFGRRHRTAISSVLERMMLASLITVSLPVKESMADQFTLECNMKFTKVKSTRETDVDNARSMPSKTIITVDLDRMKYKLEYDNRIMDISDISENKINFSFIYGPSGDGATRTYSISLDRYTGMLYYINDYDWSSQSGNVNIDIEQAGKCTKVDTIPIPEKKF